MTQNAIFKRFHSMTNFFLFFSRRAASFLIVQGHSLTPNDSQAALLLASLTETLLANLHKFSWGNMNKNIGSTES